MHLTTLGSPHRNAAGQIDNAVMVLHGTGGDGKQFLRRSSPTNFMGPASRSTSAATGSSFPTISATAKSSKPSDGMRMQFPKYDYDDMVEAQHRMLTEGLGIDHMRLIMGTSMGCMHSFVWGETYPDFASALMPLACEPIEIAGLNRMWRQLAINGIEADPAWQGGNYTSEPLSGAARRREPAVRRRRRAAAVPGAISDARGGQRLCRGASRERRSRSSTPTTSSISWIRRGTTIRGRSWSGSRCR